jgi:hypothetical protein
MIHFISKQYIVAICSVFAITSFNLCISQNAILLERLETALFPINEDSVLLVDYLKDCRNHAIDSSIYIRKNQPHFNQVMSIMEEILYSGDTSLIAPLMNMYDDFVDIFEKEWQKVNKDNISICDSIRQQINIMEGFERIIKGLQLSYISPAKKFDFFFNEFLLRRHLRTNKIDDSF